MLEIDSQSIQSKVVIATSGPYGGRQQIHDSARGWYKEHQVPLDLYDSRTLHPAAEAIAEARALDKSYAAWDTAAAHEPLPLPPGVPTATYLTADSHPADTDVARELERRLGRGLLDASPHLDALSDGIQELTKYGASVGVDALSYARRVRIVDNPKIVGGTWTDLIGVMYFGPQTFKSPFAAAESILHECLHSKAQRVARSFERVFLDDDAPENLEIPWWRTSESRTYWNFSRAFDAHHVYSHISLLAAAKWHETGDNISLTRCRIASFRAAFLLALLGTADDSDLDQQRRDMASWAGSVAVPPFGLNDTAKSLLCDPRNF